MNEFIRQPEVKTKEIYSVQYTNRLKVYRFGEVADTYLRIDSSELNVEEMASYGIFRDQMANRIPDDMEYELSTQVLPKLKDEETKNGDSRMIKEIHVELQCHHNGQSVVIPLDSISLSSHSSFIGNQLIARIPKSNGDLNSRDFRILNLSMKKEKIRHHAKSGFVFNNTALKTYRFIDSVPPAPSGFICYRAGVESSCMLPVIIERKVLEGFKARLVGHHPNEMGAQLGGDLCRNGETKYLAVTEIAFFNSIGNETRLEIPAEEYHRTSMEIENKGKRVVGWLHSHGFKEGALSVSDVDILTHHQKYTIPYAVMMVADSAHLIGASDSHDCSQCCYREHCTLAMNRNVRLLKGWSLYGWTPTGALTPIPAMVVD